MSDADAPPVWMAGLGWLERNRDGFALPRGAEPELSRLKALGELATITEVLWRRQDLDAAVRARMHALIEFAWRELEEGEVLARFLDQRPYPVLGPTYAVFERMGWRHEGTRARLAELARPGALTASRFAARPPAEPTLAQFGPDGVVVLCLGLALGWEQLGLPCPWQRARLYPSTRLAKRPDVSQLSVADAYSLTHVVFFMTDWGGDPQGLPESERSYLAEHAPRWMEGFREHANFDAYAEVAATLCCAGHPAPPRTEDVLRAAQEEDGSVHGPADRVAERTRGMEDPARRRFVSAYHTTLAATLASFAVTTGLARRTASIKAELT